MTTPKTYPAASLETAACLWEVVLELEQDGEDLHPSPLAQAIQDCRGELGTSGLRLTVLGWVDLVDTAWRIADTSNGANPRGGDYDGTFDWDFVPGWIRANVDWSDPCHPRVAVIRAREGS